MSLPARTARIFGVTLLALGSSGLAAAEEDELELELAIWDKSITLRGAFGYKDNVLLSAAQPEGSAFWQTALDFTLLRASLESGPNMTFFLSAEDRRYFSSEEIEKEQVVLAQGRIEQTFLTSWVASGTLQYLYVDQVYDASATEQILETLPVQGHNVQFSPALMRNLPWNTELELQFTIERQFFNEPLDDYWEFGPQLTFTKNYGRRSEASIGYTLDHRFYDERQERTLDFQPVPGTSLEYLQHEFEFSVYHSWDEKRRWRSRFRALTEINNDQGTGFYDYYRYRLSKRFGYYGEDWQATVEGRILHYDYVRQPVSEGTEIRSTWEYVVNAHAEKTVWKKLTVFSDIEYEIAESNYALEEYKVATIMGGVDWEF